jgi:fibronectin type 3 domain-containing protein
MQSSRRFLLVFAVALVAAASAWWLDGSAEPVQATGYDVNITEAECNRLAKQFNQTSKSRMPGWVSWLDGPIGQKNGVPTGGCVLVSDGKVSWIPSIWASPRWQEILWCYPPRGANDVKQEQLPFQAKSTAPPQSAAQSPPAVVILDPSSPGSKTPEGTRRQQRAAPQSPPPPPVNRVPAFSVNSITLMVAENTAANQSIGQALTANDPDGDVLTYKLGGKDASYFAIDAATGQIKSSSALNYEGAASYSVTVTATDGGGLSASISITITVTDVNEAPAFAAASASLSVAENTAAGTSIGSPLTAADPEGDSLTYTLGGTDAGYFAIDAATGQVKTAGKLDYETQATYNVTVAAADDDGLSAAVPVTITVTDVYEPQPVNVRASAREDGTVLVRWQAPAGVGDDVFYRVRRSLDAADAKYSVVGRQVDGLEYQDGDAILAPGKSYRYSVRAFNGADKKLGKWTAGARVTIPELNRAPAYVLASATLSVAENTASGVAIGNPLTANDPDGDALTYTLSGADAGHFAIDAASGQVKTVGNLDYESRSSYTVTVTATDGDGLSASIVVSVSITDVYEPLLVNVQVTVQEDGAVLVSWNAAAGVSDDAFYRVRRSLGDAKFHVIARLVEGQSYRDGDQLEAGQSYRYSVRAFDASGKNLDKWTAAVKITIPTSGDGSG